MPDRQRHESQDLADYQPLDGSDSLEGDPGDDPLDRGVIPPQHWSAGMRHGTTADEQAAGESLDDLLAEEEPDLSIADDESPDDTGDYDPEGAGHDDEGPDPRTGRLVAFDEGTGPARNAELYAHDLGRDADASSAEEAAVHLVSDDDT